MVDPVEYVSSKKFSIYAGGEEYDLRYKSNISLGSSNDDVTRAVVVIHGSGRNSESSYDQILDASDDAGATSTAIIAPQYLSDVDVSYHRLPANTLHWSDNDWVSGYDSVQVDSRDPASLSSFEVLNRLLLRLADDDAFPNIEEIVIAGHSGGGQHVQRYAAGGTAQTEARRDVDFQYIVANPGTYMYLSEERVVDGTMDHFAIPENPCWNYNEYKYGLEDLNDYMSTVGENQLRENYESRDVALLLGELDDDPDHHQLATDCRAMLQGEHRLERGQIFFNHVEEEFGRDILDRHQLEIIPNVGHSGRGVFTSDAALELLFGDPDTAPAMIGDTVLGTVGGDFLEGTGSGNRLEGRDGDDTLSGLGGEDTFDGGSGSDTVDYSYSSSDRLRVDLYVSDGYGYAWFLDDPTRPPGSGNRASTTEPLRDIENIIGSRGDNVLIGRGSANRIDGNSGDDSLYGSGGKDTLIGGSGEDTFDGGSGSDTVDYSYSSSDRLRVDLYVSDGYGYAWFVDDPTRAPGSGNRASTTEPLRSIENVVGSRGDNVLIGDNDRNRLEGGKGNDTLTGGGNNDTFAFGRGDDRDTITDFDDAGSDRVDARGIGFDTFSEFNTLAASSGNNSRVDAGDFAPGIAVRASGSNLVIDFGGGDILTFVTETSLTASDFVLN